MLLITQLLSHIGKEWRPFALPALVLSLTASSIQPWIFASLHTIFCYLKQEKHEEKKHPHPRRKLASGSLITHSLHPMQGGIIKDIKYSELISPFGRYTCNKTNDGCCCCVPRRGDLPQKAVLWLFTNASHGTVTFAGLLSSWKYQDCIKLPACDFC